MSSNHRGRRPGARRSEDARRQFAGVRRFFFANNSSASPAEDILGLVPLTGGRRAVSPSIHGRSFTAPLTREALRAERRAAAERTVQGVMKVAFFSFLDRLPPRLPPRPSTNPTFTSFLTQTPIMLTKELVQLPKAPSLLAQQCKLWRELPEHHHLRFVTVCGLGVVCIPTISYFHCLNKPKNSQRTSTRTERECFTIISSKRTLGSLEALLGPKKKVSGCPSVRFMKQRRHEPCIFSSRTPAAREAVPSPTSYDCTRSQQV